MNETAERVRVIESQVLSDDWYLLKKTVFDFRRADGSWQRQQRETYDRGNGATLLLYQTATRRVVLTRQFRFPAFVNGHDGMLVEAPAGLLDHATPEQRIRAEVEEETGYREYDAVSRIGAGGGIEAEGEDIEVLELAFDEAMTMVRHGEIVDGKTIMLLQYAALHLFVGDNGDFRS